MSTRRTAQDSCCTMKLGAGCYVCFGATGGAAWGRTLAPTFNLGQANTLGYIRSTPIYMDVLNPTCDASTRRNSGEIKMIWIRRSAQISVAWELVEPPATQFCIAVQPAYHLNRSSHRFISSKRDRRSSDGNSLCERLYENGVS
jgi:hypothetical protein